MVLKLDFETELHKKELLKEIISFRLVDVTIYLDFIHDQFKVFSMGMILSIFDINDNFRFWIIGIFLC